MTKADVRPDLNSGLEQPTTSTSKKEKKRKPYVKRACLSCHSAHVACDSERPCRRCKKKGIPCVDYIPSKKSKSKASTSDDEFEQQQVPEHDHQYSEPSNNNVVGDHPTTLPHDTVSSTTTTNTNGTAEQHPRPFSSPEKSPTTRTRKKKSQEHAVLRVEAPSSNFFIDSEHPTTTSSCISNPSAKYESSLAASKSSLVQHALSLSEKQNQRKTLPVVEKPKPSSTLIIEDDIENPLMATSPVGSIDALSMMDGFLTPTTTTPQNSTSHATGVTNVSATTNNSVDTNGNNTDTTSTKPSSVIYPYFYNPWWYMHMAQQNAAQNGTTTNSSQQQPQQQVLGIPPYPVFFAPIPASQIGQQPFVYNPSSLPTSQPTPTSPMQTDSAPSPSTAFPIFVDPYHLYGSSFVPKPITMLENTDDGFTDLVPNSSQPSLSSVDYKTKLEDLDVNNNGIVEEVAGILPQSNDPTSKHLTTNDIHAATTDNLEIFDDIDYFDNDVDRNNNNNSDFSLFTWQDSPLLDKKKPTTTRPVSNRASNDDEIIDLITSEASLLTERAKEQQISNRQNGNVVANSNTNNTGSSSTSSSTQDHQSLSLTTPEEINYVISQAPENSLMKQKLGDILKQIWQTQENQSKEINELKQLVSELKRMIIS